MSILLAALLMAQTEPPVRLASNAMTPPAAEAGSVEARGGDEPAEICRSVSVQRSGLISRSKRVCRTPAEWKAKAAQGGR